MLLIVRASLLAAFPSFFQFFDILIPFTVYMGQRRSLWEGAGLSLGFGYLFSLFSVAPQGFYMMVSFGIFLVVRFFSLAFYAHTRWSIAVLLTLSLLLSRVFVYLIAIAMDIPLPKSMFLECLSWNFLWGIGLSYLIFSVLRRLDEKTFKIPRINIEVAEGSL